MNSPFYGRRQAQTLDGMLATLGEGWAGLESLRSPEAPGAYQPSDKAAMALARFAASADGREGLEWLMDITLRAPLRATGQTFEETALLTAATQGRHGVGEAILAAIRHGYGLMEAAKQRTKDDV